MAKEKLGSKSERRPKKRGRGYISPEQRRTKQFMFYTTERDKEKILREKRRVDPDDRMSTSDFLARIVLNAVGFGND